MTKHYGQVLGCAAQTLFQVAGQKPEVAALVGPTAALIAMIAADIDHHVSDRLRLAEQIKSVLREARDLMPWADGVEVDAALALELQSPEAFALASIESHVVALKRALMRVHAWLESTEGKRHPDLLDKIWALLEADVTHASRGVTPLW